MRVLIVEDDPISLELLENALLEFGYEVETAENGFAAIERIRTGRIQIVITDWEMPGMSGPELCREIRTRCWSSYLYIILLTSRSGIDNIVSGLDSGADDFLVKPFPPDELRARLKAARRVLSVESRDATILALAKLAEARDAETGAHLERIREYCRILGNELASHPKFADLVDGDYVQLLYLTSPLHDIGKVGIPDSVLRKPGGLTVEEFEVMKQHTLIGGQTLEAVAISQPQAGFLAMARDIALTHHERYDGGGYPQGLAGDAIPLSGRITALADVYDALTVRRVYKPEYSHETAMSMILSERGKHFDPDVTDAFARRQADFRLMHDRLADQAPCQPAPAAPPSEGEWNRLSCPSGTG